MGDVKRKVEIAKELAEKKKKQDIADRQLKEIVRRNEVNPNPYRLGDIKQKARELEKINKEVKKLQRDFNQESR